MEVGEMTDEMKKMVAVQLYKQGFLFLRGLACSQIAEHIQDSNFSISSITTSQGHLFSIQKGDLRLNNRN